MAIIRVLLTLAALPVSVVDPSDYRSHLAEAGRRIRRRDPKDVDVPALALHLDLPVWSNDNDFEVGGVEWHTTAEILKTLGIHSKVTFTPSTRRSRAPAIERSSDSGTRVIASCTSGRCE